MVLLSAVVTRTTHRSPEVCLSDVQEKDKPTKSGTTATSKSNLLKIWWDSLLASYLDLLKSPPEARKSGKWMGRLGSKHFTTRPSNMTLFGSASRRELGHALQNSTTRAIKATQLVKNPKCRPHLANLLVDFQHQSTQAIF